MCYCAYRMHSYLLAVFSLGAASNNYELNEIFTYKRRTLMPQTAKKTSGGCNFNGNNAHVFCSKCIYSICFGHKNVFPYAHCAALVVCLGFLFQFISLLSWLAFYVCHSSITDYCPVHGWNGEQCLRREKKSILTSRRVEEKASNMQNAKKKYNCIFLHCFVFLGVFLFAVMPQNENE